MNDMGLFWFEAILVLGNFGLGLFFHTAAAIIILPNFMSLVSG